MFTLTPAAGTSGSNVDAFSFTAPLSPTNSVDASSNSFTLPASDLSGTFDGGTLVATEVTFDSNGLLIGNDLFVAPAATIYSGDPNMPTFNTGTFDILEYDNVNHNLIGEGTLTITDPSTIGQGPSQPPPLSHRLSLCSAPASSVWPEQRAAGFLTACREEESKRERPSLRRCLFLRFRYINPDISSYVYFCRSSSIHFLSCALKDPVD